MMVAHSSKKGDDGAREQAAESFYDKLKKSLEDIDYTVYGKIVDASLLVSLNVVPG